MTMIKFAELTGTGVMPLSPSTDRTPDKGVIKKSSQVGPGSLASAAGVPGHMPERLPQGRVMAPHVDVTHAVPAKDQEKKASLYALHGQYPLDSYLQVKEASQYFDTYWKHFQPEERREFASNMVKRAEDLGIQVSERARHYSADGYSEAPWFKVAMNGRRTLLEQPQVELLDLIEKHAQVLPPNEFCDLLIEFDKRAGLACYYDEHVVDPYLTTYGVKTAEEYSETIGNLHVTENDLKNLADTRLSLIKGTFDEDMAKEFKKDPVGIYKSLPVSTRTIIAKMAVNSAPGELG